MKMGCDVTQETNSECIYLNTCFQLDPFICNEIKIEKAETMSNGWQCQIECQKSQECDFWTLYWLEKG